MNKVKSFLTDNLPWLIVCLVAGLCLIFVLAGTRAEDGSVTLDSKPAKISDSTKQFIEDSQAALNRIMNQDTPTDQAVIDENSEDEVGLGFYTTIDDVLGRMLADGNNDGGAGWQCSRYTGWLGTGQWSYSSSHPDYGPRNGKDMAQYLVDYYGFKYVDTPVRGAIGSGGFNTTYGHTALYLYSTGSNTAMVNDANYVPLTVSTHNMNIDGWVWVVPGNYEPEPTPTPSGDITYSYVPGDYFSGVLVKLGLDEGNLWGENGTVKRYTEQLIEQNMLDARGNVILYTPFTLTKK